METFRWCIQSECDSKHYEICHGFILQSYTELDNVNVEFPLDIIHIVEQYYSRNLFTLRDVQQAPYMTQFTSPIFEIDGLRWYFELWPRGFQQKECVELYLCLLSFPNNIYRVNTSYTLQLHEYSVKHESPYTAFTKNSWFQAWPRTLLQSEILESLESLTFEVTFNSLFTEPKLPLCPSLSSQCTYPRESFHWVVDDEEVIKSMQSAPCVYGFPSPVFEMFGIKFYVIFYPNGSRVTRKGIPSLFLHLASLKRSDMAVHVEQTLFIMNLNSCDRCIARHDITSKGRGLLSSKVTTGDLKEFNRFSFVVEIGLIDIYRPEDIDKSILTEYMAKLQSREVKVCEVASREHTWECPLEFAISQFASLENTFSMFGLSWGASMSGLGIFRLRLRTQREEGRPDAVSIRSLVEIEEVGIRFVLKGIFDDQNTMVNWGHHRVEMQEFVQLEKCRVKLTMELIEVSFNGIDVTSDFIV